MDLLLGYLIVGLYVAGHIIYALHQAELDPFESIPSLIFASIVHMLLWPYTVYQLAQDAINPS